MDRRLFLQSVSALSVSATAGGAQPPAHGADFDPTERPIADLQRALSSGTLTAEQLTKAYLERIARLDRSAHDRNGPAFRAVLGTNPDALRAARALDAERRAGRLRGPLHGIPILLKDNIESRDRLPTTAGSRALEGSFRISDAALVARLRKAGVIVLGKTNLSEWANARSAHSCSGWSAVGGQTGNAYAPERNPSGSSSGSAVAAALSFCAAAVGTETNGSILSPSSLNGLVGLKPTHGLISGAGVVPMSPRQDTAGPIGRTAADVALLAAAMAERPLGFGSRGADLEGFHLEGVRIGMMPADKGSHPQMSRLYASVRGVLEREGAVLVDLKSPAAFEEMDDPESEVLLFELKAAINDYLASLDPGQVPVRSLADLIAFNSAHAAEELAVFGQDLFEDAQARGPLTDPAYAKQLATLTRAADAQGLAALLAQQDVELLLAPGNGPAELIDPVWGDRSGSGGWPQIASAAAIAGYPSLACPAGLINGLPVGMVLVGRRFQDGLLLQVAHAFERAALARVPPRLSA